MEHSKPNAGILTWVVRILLALAALAAPIVTFKAFTDSDTPDPVRQQRLREAQDGNVRPRPASDTTSGHPYNQP